ncbi:MAG: TonB-dependent receptor [Chitinophagaceae bacterium]
MKRIIIFILTYFLYQYATANDAAKSILTGVITDAKTKAPLQGGSIFIHDIKVAAVSKKDGSYSTVPFQSGKYLVEVSYQGYASIIETIELNGTTIKNFSLTETVVEQEAVTVTGTTSATKIKNSPQPVTIVSKTDLLRTSSTNIIDALSKSVPGFSMLSTGPAISKPIIRGLGYNRMITINDGVRQEGQQWGDEHGIEIDESSVQKVEVLKGAASLMYGSDAMAGVLNIISNQPVQQSTIKSNINAGYNANNKMYSTYANVAGNLKNGFNWNIYNSYKSAADYENKYDGKVFNSRFKELNFGGYVGINKHWGYSHLLISNFNQQLGLIEGSRDAVTGEFTVFAESPQEHIATNEELNSRNFFTPYQRINHFKIALDNNINLNKGRLTFNLAFQQNNRKEFGNPDAATTPDLFFNLQTINYNLQYHLQEKNGFKTSIGINGMQQQNKNKADEVLIPEYKQFDMGAFIITKKTFNKLSLSGGVRTDFRNIKTTELVENSAVRFASINNNFTNFTASVGGSYNVNDNLTLKLNMSRGFRAPNVSELSSNGAHEGTNRYEYGNNQLKSETSFQVDAGVEISSEHISFSATTFYNNISNYIFYNKLSAVGGGDSLVNVDGEDITAFQFNQSNAVLMGFEANLDIHPHPLDWLHIQNTFSLVRGQFLNDFNGSKNLPFMPPPRLLSEVKADFKKAGKLLKNAFAKLEIDNTFSQQNIFTSYNTETTTPAYTLLNFSLGSDIKLSNNNTITMVVAINNIADIAYQSHLSRLKYTDINNATGRIGVFNMGRNFSLKVNVPLGFHLK